jgi:uncharacterized membrane protein YbhN (UPF0104 family)
VSGIKSYLRLAGSLLSLACVGWVIYRFAGSGVTQRLVQSPQAGAVLKHAALAACVYAAAVVLLALGWYQLQRGFSHVQVPGRASVGTYLFTQFGKYMPGNVAQYAGRHVLLRRQGLNHLALIYCTVTEAGLLTASALVFAAPLMAQLAFAPSSAWIIALVLSSLVLCVIGIPWLRQRSAWLSTVIVHFSPGRLAAAFVLHLAFFSLMGFTLSIVASAVPDMARHGVSLFAAAALSWLAGYFVIGAPAGLGVREAVFLFLLKGALPEEQILLVVAAFRVATFGGDVLAFIVALPLLAPSRRRSDRHS